MIGCARVHIGPLPALLMESSQHPFATQSSSTKTDPDPGTDHLLGTVLWRLGAQRHSHSSATPVKGPDNRVLIRNAQMQSFKQFVATPSRLKMPKYTEGTRRWWSSVGMISRGERIALGAAAQAKTVQPPSQAYPLAKAAQPPSQAFSAANHLWQSVEAALHVESSQATSPRMGREQGLIPPTRGPWHASTIPCLAVPWVLLQVPGEGT